MKGNQVDYQAHSIFFFVPGIPVPKGSAKAFVNKKTGKAIVMQDNRESQKPWASMIGYCAQQECREVLTGPIMLSLEFVMPRTADHYGTGRNAGKLKDTAPYWHTKKPDLDKLVRCVKDALTGIAWRDDSQVSLLWAVKTYGQRPGVHVEISKRNHGIAGVAAWR